MDNEINLLIKNAKDVQKESNKHLSFSYFEFKVSLIKLGISFKNLKVLM